MNVLSEKDIEAYFKKRIEKLGGLCLKFVSPGFTGVPDRLAILPGKIFFYELKSKKGKQDARQEIVSNQLSKLGFPVVVINSIQEADKQITECVKSLL